LQSGKALDLTTSPSVLAAGPRLAKLALYSFVTSIFRREINPLGRLVFPMAEQSFGQDVVDTTYASKKAHASKHRS
jgi:hypothetical protein